MIGIALNTSNLKEKEARREIEKTEDETNLPTTDPVRFGSSKFLKALEYLKRTNVLSQM
jgi:uncharacterized NAD-dependent epimerase/dehydratase family protein